MYNIVYTSPQGDELECPDLELLQEYILQPPEKYWIQGSGDASLSFKEKLKETSLLILPNESYGFYLKFLVSENNRIANTWLSLNDPLLLDRVIECSEEWYASIGLFLPPNKAWWAIEEFCKTGIRTDKVQWITPDDIPEGGNW